MNPKFDLIVTDASPLITLAAADALRLLTVTGMTVIIPDMVYYEVTRDLAKLGAMPLIDWVKQNPAAVHIAPTSVFGEYQALQHFNPKTPSRGRGELSASEVLQDAVTADPDLMAFLLFEDGDINRRRFADLLPERVMPISTGAFLNELEQAGIIQSATHILDEATTKGRDVSKQYVAVTPRDVSKALRDRLRPSKTPGPER